MPRKGRGGSRQGTPGTAYGNRNDLNNPISTVPNQEYGKATEQRSAQQTVRMASSPVAQAPALTRQAPPVAQPGSLPTYEPTQRPEEPVTAGLPFGPGPGPEAMQPDYASFGRTLQSAAREGSGSALAVMLASSAKSLGF